MRTGRAVRALSGIKFGSAPHRLANGRLALRIVFVRPASPAARAGLRPGDILLTAGGYRVRRTVDFRALLRGRPPPFTIDLVILRDGQRRRVRLSIPEQPDLALSPAAPSGDTNDGQ